MKFKQKAWGLARHHSDILALPQRKRKRHDASVDEYFRLRSSLSLSHPTVLLTVDMSQLGTPAYEESLGTPLLAKVNASDM